MDSAEILRLIVEEFPLALLGSVLVGSLCAFIGVYIVARRVVFLGAVMTQLSVLGLSITFLPFVALPHTIGSLVITLFAVALLSRWLSHRSIPGDAMLGVVFAAAIALRILVLQKSPRVEASEVDNLLRGDILFVTPELFFLMAVVFVATVFVHFLYSKQFTFVTFDAETAAAQGIDARRWESVFFVTAAVAISVATHLVGDLFVFGFLVIPPVTALLLGARVRQIFAISAILGAILPFLGLYLAFVIDVPASPAIVAGAAVVLALAWVVRLIRGKQM
jgi:zinc transport system permease protein